MAKKFPNADVVGIDVVPTPIAFENVPPNCEFEIDDIQLGLTHFHHPSKQFDLIHAKTISMGLRHFSKTIRDAQMCLKPGGLIIWIEADHEVFSPETYDVLPIGSDIYPNGSWMGRIVFGKLKQHVRVLGQQWE